MIIIYSYWNYIILAAYKQACSGHVSGLAVCQAGFNQSWTLPVKFEFYFPVLKLLLLKTVILGVKLDWHII